MLALARPVLLGLAAASRCPPARMRVLQKYTPSDFPDAWPYDEQDMQRMDESMDFNFYSQPRFVTHIDEGAIAAKRQEIAQLEQQIGQHLNIMVNVNIS